MAQGIRTRDRPTGPRLTPDQPARPGPTEEPRGTAGKTSSPVLPNGYRSPPAADQDHRVSGSTDRGLERARIGGSVGPSFGPLDELDGQDERDGQGDLAEALGGVAVGVAA